MGRTIEVVLIFIWLGVVLSCWSWLCIKENRLQRRQNGLKEDLELSYQRLKQPLNLAHQVNRDRTSSHKVENSTAQSVSSPPPAYRPATILKGIRKGPHTRRRESRVYWPK